MTTLNGQLVICLLDDEFEDLELWYPVYRTREAGATVLFAAPEKNKTYIGKYGVPATSDLSYDELNSQDIAGILVPGGWAPDKIRRYPKVLELLQQLDKDNKPIGQICHAGWVLISAKILNGRKVTSTPGIKDDMENAGATWFDEAVVVDNNIVSARRPPDLPPYAKAFVEVLEQRMV